MRSLSSRLLVLTVLFVMVAEVLIFVPSVARFREAWFSEKLGSAHLAILTLDATPDRRIGEMLRDELLGQVGAYALFLRRKGARHFIATDMPPPVIRTFDLQNTNAMKLIADAFMALIATEDRVIRIIGPSPKDPKVIIEIVMDERPLQQALKGFSWRIFGLSLGISLFAAILVFLSLQWLLVRPMRRITASMTAFRSSPEDVNRIINPTSRNDEIGTAERELAEMQRGLRAALKQKANLAALGSAVAKVNHDLRGILSSALLVSDSLESVQDPEVRRVAPRLMSSIERAVALCTDSLDYVSGKNAEIKRESFSLRQLTQEIAETVSVSTNPGATVTHGLDGELKVIADRELLYRALGNLVRNAAEAGAKEIRFTAENANGQTVIDVVDDGPGIPERALANLFLPFEGSTRAGGTGLGLAIAKEVAHLHGGDLTLMRSGQEGTVFQLKFPNENALFGKAH